MIKASLHMGVYFWGRGTIDNGKRKSFPARPDFPILAFSDSCLRQTSISCENMQFFLLTITIHKHLIIDPQSGAKFLSFQQINYGLLDSYFDRVAIGKFMAQAAGLC